MEPSSWLWAGICFLFQTNFICSHINSFIERWFYCHLCSFKSYQWVIYCNTESSNISSQQNCSHLTFIILVWSRKQFLFIKIYNWRFSPQYIIVKNHCVGLDSEFLVPWLESKSTFFGYLVHSDIHQLLKISWKTTGTESYLQPIWTHDF